MNWGAELTLFVEPPLVPVVAIPPLRNPLAVEPNQYRDHLHAQPPPFELYDFDGE